MMNEKQKSFEDDNEEKFCVLQKNEKKSFVLCGWLFLLWFKNMWGKKF